MAPNVLGTLTVNGKRFRIGYNDAGFVIIVPHPDLRELIGAHVTEIIRICVKRGWTHELC